MPIVNFDYDFVADFLDKHSEEMPRGAAGQEGSSRTRNVLGGVDDRRRVNDTRIKPFRWVCQVFAVSSQAPRGVKGVGSGFVIGQRSILTAAHNLKIVGVPAEYFQIFLACDGDRNAPPLGSYRATRCVAHPAYERPGDRRHDSRYDLAIIFLDQPLPDSLIPPPYRFGAMPLAVVSPSLLNGHKGLVAGYPKDYPIHDRHRFSRPEEGVQAFQYYCVSQVRGSPALLSYELDTGVGQSGSPLIMLQTDANGREYSVAVGVHIEGGNDATGNFAVPLDSERMEFISSVMSKEEGGRWA